MRAGLSDNAPLTEQPQVGSYFQELTKAMEMLARHPRAIFMGQSVAYPGTAMRNTLLNVPAEKLLELPVAEDMQMGMAIGMSLSGELPICIYPRINFMFLCLNQLVLHLDKLPLYGNGYKPKVIIRTAVATAKPLDPGPQHLGDYSEQFSEMLDTVLVQRLLTPDRIVPEYRAAMEREGSTLLVEYAELYDAV